MQTASIASVPQRSPFFPFAGPFALFLGLTATEAEFVPLAWYPYWYAVKIAAVLSLLWIGRSCWPIWSSRGIGLGIGIGAAGVVAWILLAHPNVQTLLATYLPSWIVGGARTAFDPFAQLGSGGLTWSFIAVRMMGLALVVPLMEELFWRGFVARWLIEDRFETVPIGTFTWTSFVVTTLAFASVHPELIAALVWGAAIQGLLYLTRNLWACVAAHAVTNLLLGAYVLATGDWRLW